MGRKRRPKQTGKAKPGWWESLDPARKRRAKIASAWLVGASVVLGGAAVGLAALEQQVDDRVNRTHTPSVYLMDLPPELAPLAREELLDELEDELRRIPRWTDPRLCHLLSDRLMESGWVGQVRSVRRFGDGRFELSCRYRVPVALIANQSQLYMVDSKGTRLPGTYRDDTGWHVIRGVTAPPPPIGVVWKGDDVQAGISMAQVLSVQPYSNQVSAILVDNIGGRVDPRHSHVELATDRAGGRIRWGSAPGKEVEENTIQRKLGILLENFRRTGRADADYLVIDVSTFPDRFLVPG